MTMKSVELALPAAPSAPVEARAVVEAIGSDLPEAVLVDAKLLLTGSWGTRLDTQAGAFPP